MRAELALGRGRCEAWSTVDGFRIDRPLAGGMTLSVTLPRARSDVADRTPAASVEDPPRVLLVEDEPMIALAVADLLTSFGYEVIEAHDGRAAKAAFDAHPRIDVVVTDLGLPDIDGEALAEWARGRRPTLPIVFSTGRDDFEPPPLLALGGYVRVVQKPFDSETLRRTLEACAPLSA